MSHQLYENQRVDHNFEPERHYLNSVLYRYFGLTSDNPTDEDSIYFKPTFNNKFNEILFKIGSLGLMLAGGSILSIVTKTKVNDLDFYIKNPNNINDAIVFFTSNFQNEGEPHVTDNAITFKRRNGRRIYKAQLITRFTGNVADILNTFDFTVCQGIYDFAENVFGFSDRFWTDLAKKRLVYVGSSQYPICALYRTKKYQDKGFYLPGSTVMHIALSIIRLKITNYKELKEQLMGIDTMFLQGLLSQSKFDDRLPVNYGEFLVEALNVINNIGYELEDVSAEGPFTESE